MGKMITNGPSRVIHSRGLSFRPLDLCAKITTLGGLSENEEKKYFADFRLYAVSLFKPCPSGETRTTATTSPRG